MNRRDLFRRSLMGAALAASERVAPAREFPSGYDASKELARADWKPLFFDDHQNETLIAFSDVLIPETATPGAKTALVNRFLDLVLAAETHDAQRRFLESLAWLDGESFDRYRAAFVHLKPEQQVDVLTLMAYPHSYNIWEEGARAEYPGHRHFENLKGWVSRAYYTSEAGMRSLGYNGVPHGVFAGCTHGEHS